MVRPDRFGQKIIATDAHDTLLHVSVAFAGQEDDRNRIIGRLLPDRRRQFTAVIVRHVEIHQDQFRPEFRHDIQRLGRVRHDYGRDVGLMQDRFVIPRDLRIVVDDHHAIGLVLIEPAQGFQPVDDVERAVGRRDIGRRAAPDCIDPGIQRSLLRQEYDRRFRNFFTELGQGLAPVGADFRAARPDQEKGRIGFPHRRDQVGCRRDMGHRIAERRQLQVERSGFIIAIVKNDDAGWHFRNRTRQRPSPSHRVTGFFSARGTGGQYGNRA